MLNDPLLAELTVSTDQTYQVGVFALVRHQDSVLLVRPRRLLLPGGPQSLPGSLISVQHSGLGVVEQGLRRTLLAQVGVAVGDFTLLSSHATRSSEAKSHLARLNLIFGTEYCSGLLNPQAAELLSAHWIPYAQLQQVKLPVWLQAALEASLLRQPLTGHQKRLIGAR